MEKDSGQPSESERIALGELAHEAIANPQVPDGHKKTYLEALTSLALDAYSRTVSPDEMERYLEGAHACYVTMRQEQADKQVRGALMQEATTYHIHIPLRVLLGYSDKKLGETVTHPDGVQAAREELRQMQMMGKTVLAAGKCDNKHPDGSCAGHPAGEEKAA